MKQTKVFCVSATSYGLLKLESQINEWLVSIKEGQSKRLCDIKIGTVEISNQTNNIYALAIYDEDKEMTID